MHRSLYVYRVRATHHLRRHVVSDDYSVKECIPPAPLIHSERPQTTGGSPPSPTSPSPDDRLVVVVRHKGVSWGTVALSGALAVCLSFLVGVYATWLVVGIEPSSDVPGSSLSIDTLSSDGDCIVLERPLEVQDTFSISSSGGGSSLGIRAEGVDVGGDLVVSGEISVLGGTAFSGDALSSNTHSATIAVTGTNTAPLTLSSVCSSGGSSSISLSGGLMTFTTDAVSFSANMITIGTETTSMLIPGSTSITGALTLSGGLLTDSVSITGGAIDGTTIGATIPSVGSFSSINIGNYSMPTAKGTAGQVLSSDGEGAAVWSTPSAPATGHSLSAIARESIGVRDPVVINADGTVSAVAGALRSSSDPVPIARRISGDGYVSSMAIDATGNAVVVYTDDMEEEMRANLVLVNGTDVTLRPDVLIDSVDRDYGREHPLIVYHAASGFFVIVYNTYGNTADHGMAQLASVTDGVLVFGTPVVYSDFAQEGLDVTYDSQSEQIIVAFMVRDAGHVVAGSVSDGVLSFGTPVQFSSDADNNNVAIDYNPVHDTSVIVYNRDSDRIGVAVLCTVTGNSITVVSEAEFSTGRIRYPSVGIDTSTGLMLLAYCDVSSDTSYGVAKATTISAGSITIGPPVTFASMGWTMPAVYYMPSSGEMVIMYSDPSLGDDGVSVVATLSSDGLTVSFEAPAMISSTEDSDMCHYEAVYSPVEDTMIVAHANTPSNYGCVLSYQKGYSNLDSSPVVGVATDTYTSGATASIVTAGGIVDGYSGLVP
ncbi:hypothetical protein KIPB_010362, partial [Kipferlia bialata]|eukprot:g10362.t1